MEKQDKCCHSLTYLQRLRMLQTPLKSNRHAVHAQTLTPTPPIDLQKSIPNFTSGSYNIDQSSEMKDAPLPGKELNQVINALLETNSQEKPISSSTLSINKNPLQEAHKYVKSQSDFSMDKILRKSQNHRMEHNLSSGASSQDDLSDNSFEILTSHFDERTPYSLKKVASSSVEINHLGINNNHYQNDRSLDNEIHDTYSSCPNNPNDEALKSYIKSREEQMTIDIQPLKISESSCNNKKIINSQCNDKLESHKHYTIATEPETEKIQQNTNSERIKLECLSKNENINISQTSQTTSIQKKQQETNSEKFRLDCLSENENRTISQKSQMKDLKNWQHDNCKGESSDPHTLKETFEIESPKMDTSIQCPTLFTILNEGATYKDGRLSDPCNTKNIVIKKEQAFLYKQGKNPIPLPPETEILMQNTMDSHEQMEHTSPNDHDPVLDLSNHLQEQDNSIKKLARKYSFRDGQHPYTAIFISLAPPPKPSAAQVEATHAAAGANAASMGANATAARAILTKVAQRPPTKDEYNKQLHEFSQSFLCEYTRQAAPDILQPWQPRERSYIPLLSQKQPDPFQHWYSTRRAGVNNKLNNFHPDHFANDIRDEVDKEIDRIQDFNDQVLEINGYNMIPYRGLPVDVFAGSFTTNLTQGLSLYVCKPCDMAGFLKTNFILHHESNKHQHNIRVWILQHYVPPSQNNTHQDQPTEENKSTGNDINQSRIMIDPENYQHSLHVLNPSQELEKIMKKIKASYFPTKYRQEVAGLITKFFVSKHDLEVGFTKEFKDARDHTGDRHWIILAYEFLQQQQDPRQYMKEKLIQQDLEFCEKTPVQQNEVKFISDLARILFLICINCDFVPTNYIIMLAIIMTKKNKLNYPESNTGLFNAHYLDLFLNVGAMTLSYKVNINEDQHDLSLMLNGANIKTEENDPNQYLAQEVPAINRGSRAWTWDELKTEKKDTEEYIAGIQGVTDEDLILHGPLSEDIKILNLTKNQVTTDGMNPDQEYAQELAEGDQAWSADETQSSTSSSDSIPSLESFHYDTNNQPSFSPMPSTSTSNGNSTKGKNNLKTQQKNAIYIRNLKPSITYKELLEMGKKFGPVKKIVITGDKNAIMVFHNKSNAKSALHTMNGKFIGQSRTKGILAVPLKVQYALNPGTNKGKANKKLPKRPSKTSTPPKSESITNGLQYFNNSSYLICSIENVTIPKYSNKEIKVKLINEKSPNESISNTTVSISCGLAPQIQLSEGIFEVTNSTTLVSIRNNANYPLKLEKHQIIKGTDCHFKNYVNNNTIHKKVCYSSYHLQCKTYKRMNQFNNMVQESSSTRYETNHQIEENNQWIMQ